MRKLIVDPLLTFYPPNVIFWIVIRHGVGQVRSGQVLVYLSPQYYVDIYLNYKSESKVNFGL